jgi:hypothetical protein
MNISTKLGKQPSIVAAWESYRRLALKPDAPAEAVEDIRLAFWAGAAVLFYSILDIQADFQCIADIAKEIDRFSQTFDAEVLPRRGRHQ